MCIIVAAPGRAKRRSWRGWWRRRRMRIREAQGKGGRGSEGDKGGGSQGSAVAKARRRGYVLPRDNRYRSSAVAPIRVLCPRRRAWCWWVSVLATQCCRLRRAVKRIHSSASRQVTISGKKPIWVLLAEKRLFDPRPRLLEKRRSGGTYAGRVSPVTLIALRALAHYFPIGIAVTGPESASYPGR